MNKPVDYVNHYKNDALEFNYFEERFGATKNDEERVHEYILSKLPKNVNRILDVGAGSGWLANYFLLKDVEVISLDISKFNIDKINEISGKKLGIVSDSLNLAIHNNTLDCVIASEIIEHVVDPQKFVNQLFSILKPGGKLIITTPYKEKLRYYLCIHCNKKTPAHAHLHSFDENILTSLCDSEELDKVEYFKFGNKLLIFLRTYIILQYFPFFMWKFIDRFFNFIKAMPVHILVQYTKKN